MKICLAMIVKNESRSIERCLRAAAPFVDEIHIADTGSNDDTVYKIERLRDSIDIPVRLYYFEWVQDFSLARNFILSKADLAGADWNLVLDADEYLLSDRCPEEYPKPKLNKVHSNRQDLEAFIERIERVHGRNCIGCIGQYHLINAKNTGDIEQQFSFSPRILPTGLRYKGAIHELPDAKFPLITSPLRTEHDGYLSPVKPERNLPYLEKAIKENPDDPYYYYQLARTVGALGRYDEAKEAYLSFYKLSPVPKGPQPDYRFSGILSFLSLLMEINNSQSLNLAKEIFDMEEEGGKFELDSDFYFLKGLFLMKFILIDPENRLSFFPDIEKSFLRCLSIGEDGRLHGDIGTGSFKALFELGLFYELTGDKKRALINYSASANQGYTPARERLSILDRENYN